MISKVTQSVSCDRDGYRLKEERTTVRLFGILLYKSQKEIAREAAPITPLDRLVCQALDSWECVYCGTRQLKALTIDHVLPRVKGGASAFANYETACRSCSSRKNAFTPQEALVARKYGRHSAAFAFRIGHVSRTLVAFPNCTPAYVTKYLFRIQEFRLGEIIATRYLEKHGTTQLKYKVDNTTRIKRELQSVIVADAQTPRELYGAMYQVVDAHLRTPVIAQACQCVRMGRRSNRCAGSFLDSRIPIAAELYW